MPEKALSLSTSLQSIKGVGPARADALSTIGVHTVSDLLHYYPRKHLDRTTVTPISKLKRDKNVQMIGMDSSKVSLVIPGIEMESGKMPDSNDLTAIVLGFNIAHPSGADSPFAEEGDLVKAEFTRVKDVGNVQKRVTKGKSFLVKGIVEEQGNMIYDNAIIVPLSPAGSLLDRGRNFDQIFIVTEDADMNDGIEIGIREIYGNDIGITSPKSIIESVQNIASGFQMFVFSIAVVSLIVGGTC